MRPGHAAEGNPTPWTPVIWLVLWVSMMVGMLKGFSSGAGVLYSKKFRQLWFPREKLNPAVLTGTDLGDAVCISSNSDTTWYLAVKYIVGSAVSLPAGWVIRVHGRRLAILLGCACYSVAHCLQGAAVNMNMLIAAQVFHGIAGSFLYQAPYIEVAEVAPHQWRGAFVLTDPLGQAVGVWTRTLLHAGLGNEASSPSWGWRLSSLFPLWPASVVMMLVPWIPETPNSLIQRGKLEAGRAALQDIRGQMHDVDDEFAAILKAAGIQNTTKRPPWQLQTLLRRHQLPPLLLMVLITVLAEFMGANAMRLYGRNLWDVLHSSLHGFALQQIEDACYLLAVVGSILAMDTWGRRPVLSVSAIGCGLGCIAAAGTAISVPGLTTVAAQAVVFASMLFGVASYTFGMGGGYWLLMAELFPLATRTLATSMLTGVVFLMSAVTSLFALSWVCSMRSGLLLIYAGGNVALLLTVLLFLPETKCVALEDIHKQFEQHWLWRHFKQREQPAHLEPAAARMPRQKVTRHGQPAVHKKRQPAAAGASGACVRHAAAGQQLDHDSSSSVAEAPQVVGGVATAAGAAELPTMGAIQQHAQQCSAGGTQRPPRALSIQPAGTISLDLDDFLYGRRQ